MASNTCYHQANGADGHPAIGGLESPVYFLA